MPSVACLDYMRFISTNKVEDWSVRNALVDIAQALRQPIWNFFCKHNVSVTLFTAIREDMWPRVSNFIERHMQPGNTELSKYTIDVLIKISDEDWPEFNRFLDAHQIHDFEMIQNYAVMSALQRNYLFDFTQRT